MPSAGFLVVSLLATMFVIVPSALLFAYGWRSGNIGRFFAVSALLLLVAFGWLAFTDPEHPDFESRAFSLFVLSGFVVYLGGAMFPRATVTIGLLKKLRIERRHR